MRGLVNGDVNDFLSSFSAAHWSVWATLLIIFFLLLAGIQLVRRLRTRRWQTLRAARYAWLVEVILVPAVIWAIGWLLSGMSTDHRLDRIMDLGTGIVLVIALAWLADRGIGLFLLPKGSDGQSIDVPRILRTGISTGLYALAAIFAAVIFLDQDTFGFVISGSVVLGVVGLAMQGILQDTFAGVAISIDKSYRLGDWIELEDGTTGQVLDISWRTTRLRTFEHGILIVPNAQIYSSRIHNHTLHDQRHAVMLYVNLPNEIDPAMGKRLLLEVLLDTPEVLAHPAPSVSLVDAGGRPHQYLLIAYCRDRESRVTTISRINERLWNHLQRLGMYTVPAASDNWLHRSPVIDVRAESLKHLLRMASLLKPLTDEELDLLQSSVQRNVLPEASIVVREDDHGDSLFIVAGGRLEVLVEREDQPIARLGIGDYFGEMSLLTGTPRSATVRTVTECILLEIGKDALTPILKRRPELGEELAQVEARRQLEIEAAMAQDATLTEADIRKRARKVLGGMRSFFGL